MVGRGVRVSYRNLLTRPLWEFPEVGVLGVAVIVTILVVVRWVQGILVRMRWLVKLAGEVGWLSCGFALREVVAILVCPERAGVLIARREVASRPIYRGCSIFIFTKESERSVRRGGNFPIEDTCL